MKSYTTIEHIHYLGGELVEIDILGQRGDGKQTVYVVYYKGVRYTVIFTPFVCFVIFCGFFQVGECERFDTSFRKFAFLPSYRISNITR